VNTKELYKYFLEKISIYGVIIIAFSGGKDSLAVILFLLKIGIHPDKIELWHHDIDGRGRSFMDWECTPDYCQKVADYLGIRIYFSWLEGGFEREMLRKNSKKASTIFEDQNKDLHKVGGTSGKLTTREKFPQVSADLKVRWCSAYLKIDVMSMAINNQPRFKGDKTMVLTGERALESKARSKYLKFEAHRTDAKSRYVDHWRPVIDWTESEVWDIIKQFGINPHPAYHLGWNRVSCKWCIFGSANQFKSSYKISPEQGDKLISYEKQFGCTIKRKDSVSILIEKGVEYDMDMDMMWKSVQKLYNDPIFVENWILPNGAYGESCGPT
jgi:3'-phosphoadenosine 5'-phosphosulfate sulfotransferase (PAPS reductase)/FAD synthetase